MSVYVVQADVLSPDEKFLEMIEKFDELIRKEGKLITGGIRPKGELQELTL